MVSMQNTSKVGGITLRGGAQVQNVKTSDPI